MEGNTVKSGRAVIPEIRMNSLKSLAMNWGPLSEMTRGLTPRLGPFRNDLNVGLGRRFPQIPIENERACSKYQGPIRVQ